MFEPPPPFAHISRVAKKTPTYLCISLAVGSLSRVIPGHILPSPYTNDPSGGKKDCLGFFVGFFRGRPSVLSARFQPESLVTEKVLNYRMISFSFSGKGKGTLGGLFLISRTARKKMGLLLLQTAVG